MYQKKKIAIALLLPSSFFKNWCCNLSLFISAKKIDMYQQSHYYALQFIFCTDLISKLKIGKHCKSFKQIYKHFKNNAYLKCCELLLILNVTKRISLDILQVWVIFFCFQIFNFLFKYSYFESAKLRALSTKTVFTCQHALCAYVLTCQRVLRAYVLTYQCVMRAYVLTCQRVLRAHVLKCQRVLRAHVLTCQCALWAYVLMCQRVNVPCVLTFSHANVSCVLTCSRTNVLCVITCSRDNMLWVPCLTRFMWPSDHLPTCFASIASSYDATIFSLTAAVVEVVHTVGEI